MAQSISLDLSTLYATTGTAKLGDLPAYELAAREVAGTGNDVTLTGPAPVWLYLRVAHALHGRVRCLFYDSPVTGELMIYDHNPH